MGAARLLGHRDRDRATRVVFGTTTAGTSGGVAPTTRTSGGAATTTRSDAVIRLAVCAALLAGCVKDYKVRVELTPTAADRRLASGKSDTVDGFLKSSDGTGVVLSVDGQLETVPRADIARVDQKLAKRDVTYGTVFAIAGGVIAIVGLAVFECGKDEFPIFCSFSSERNLGAGLAVLGGIALTGAGLKAVFTGKASQSRTDEILRGQRVGWDVVPARIGDGFGLGAVGRF